MCAPSSLPARPRRHRQRPTARVLGCALPPPADRWMAPEVIRHEEYGSACDVYSFAILAWEMLTYRIPLCAIAIRTQLLVSSAADLEFETRLTVTT